MDSQVQDLYKIAGSNSVPQEDIDRFNNNAIINRAQKIVESKPAFQESLKGVPRDSVGYWHLIKQSLDDMQEKAPSNEARIISNTRKDLNTTLANASPEYAQGNALYERKATRAGLEKVLDSKTINGRNFYEALKSQNKFAKLMHNLRNVPEAQDKLKSMRELFNDLMDPPTIKTAKGSSERGMFQIRNTGRYLENLMETLFSGGKYDEHAIDFITSPNWMEQMEQIKKIPDRNLKLAALSSVIGRASSQAAASNLTNGNQ
jgi:hypothetical protein